MTNEQREFKIKKRTSYEEQVKQENKRSIGAAFFVGVGAIAALCGFGVGTAGKMYQDVGLVCGILGTLGGAGYLRSLITSICRKIMLEGKIEDIDMELGTPENEIEIEVKIEESKGINR